MPGRTAMWGKALPLGRVAAIDLRLDLSWFLIAALLTWSLSAGYLPELVPGAGPGALAATALVAVAGLFASIVLHEMGHALVAQAHGMEVRAITLFVFGGVAELSAEPPDARTELRVAVAGPLVSLALGALALGAWRAADSAGAGGLPVAVLRYLALANVVLAAFNMLPAFPLDGGRVLRAWLWRTSGDVASATRRAARVSMWIAAGLIALGLAGLLAGGSLGGLWPALLGLFILAASRSARTQVDVVSALGGRRVVEVMRPDPEAVGPDLTLEQVVEEVMLRRGVSFVPVTEDGRLLGTLDLRAVRGIDRDLWATTRVDDVFAPLAEGDAVAPEDPAHRLFERMAREGRRKFAVQDRGRLVGVVTLVDLLERVRVEGEVRGLARK